MECLVNRLLDKSKEAFVMAIELYNKPTIHYRVEGFSMFICNAWELMLKAHMIPQNFLTLSVSLKALNEAEISAKYPEIISKKLFSIKNSIEALESTENPKFAININVNHYITKDRKSADAIFHIAKDGEEPVTVIKELKEPELVFKYTAKTSIETIINMLTRNKVQPLYNGQPAAFTKYHFSNLVKYFGIKNNKKFCWKYDVGNTTFYRYSLQALEFIVEEIKKDPENILNKIK